MDSETDPTCIRKWTRIQTQTREISQIQNPTQPVLENEPEPNPYMHRSGRI